MGIVDERLVQARLRNLISNLHEAVLVENEHRQIVLVNNAFCQLFGIDLPPEVMVGADCSNAAEESKVLFLNPEKFVCTYRVFVTRKSSNHWR